MAHFDHNMELPEGGTADVRLFPLPNLVMFPHVLQPLHIYEPRYCEMLEDALADNQLIATALLERGWQQEHDGRPPIASTVCVGRVVSHSPDGDGRHNILLLGVRRARVRIELATERPYRQAEVRLLGDYYSATAVEQRQKLRRHLVNSFRRHLPTTEAVQEQFEQLLSSQVPLGVLTDLVAFTMNFDLEVKLQLLQQLNVDRRALTLLERLNNLKQELGPRKRQFPPEFSLN